MSPQVPIHRAKQAIKSLNLNPEIQNDGIFIVGATYFVITEIQNREK